MNGLKVNDAVSRFSAVERCLREDFIARDDMIRGMMLALMLREHVLIVGPVGTAKSLIASRLCGSISDAEWFWYQLTQFTTPSELMGPVSVKALAEDKYMRNTKGMLPSAHIVFLDEVFRGSSAVLNTLLSLMNERIYFNDGPRKGRLISLIGTSNTLPSGVDTEALLDRFLFRFHTKRLHPFELESLVMMSNAPTRTNYPSLTVSDIAWLHETLSSVRIPDTTLSSISRLAAHWSRVGTDISERRVVKSISALRANALLSGRLSVENDDIPILTSMLCRNPDDVRHFVPIMEAYFPSDRATNLKYLIAATEEYNASIRYMERCKLASDRKESLNALAQCLSSLQAISGRMEEGPYKKRVEAMVGDLTDHTLMYSEKSP